MAKLKTISRKITKIGTQFFIYIFVIATVAFAGLQVRTSERPRAGGFKPQRGFLFWEEMHLSHATQVKEEYTEKLNHLQNENSQLLGVIAKGLPVQLRAQWLQYPSPWIWIT
eukprot:1183345-Prorocentrum_minimum.AAC.4